MHRKSLPFVMLVAVAAALGLNAAAARADTALQSGVPSTLPTLASNTYVSDYYVDVDASAQQLKVQVNASGSDVDLFVRFGTPFPVQDSTASYPTVSYDLLSRYAEYHSISSAANESILVQPSSYVPLQAGRWYIAVINGGSGNATGTVTATLSTSAAPTAGITLDFANPRTNASDPTQACEDSFWTDTTPVSAVGGNPGTTLGEQRKNALTYAAGELTTQLHITVPITVHACGAHLGGDQNSATLAHAGPTTYFYDEPLFPLPMLPEKYTWYPGTAAVNLAGTSLCGFAGGSCSGVNNEEIEATFNEDVGSSDVIGGADFYLGYDTAMRPSGTFDFITIAMHEMTHGLGFLGLVNVDSSQGPIGARAGIIIDKGGASATIGYQGLSDGPFDDVFDDSVAIVDRTAKTYTAFMPYEVNGSGDADRAAAMVSGPTITKAGAYNPGFNCTGYTGPCTGLRWLDAVAAGSGANVNAGKTAPDDFPSLYAPCDKSATPAPTDCATQTGSTLSHTTQSGDMMNAYYSNGDLRNMGLAVPMLAPVGWSDAARAMPTFATPIPSNWFDVSHNGHGFDFQLAAHDAAHGDVYFLTFYTYKSDGTPEWYQAVGRLIDGVFLPGPDVNSNTLHRVVYTADATHIISASLDDSVIGSVVVDFNQAEKNPACRDADRSGAAQLAIMSWRIGGDSGAWCMQPIVAADAHASPDYNGHWYAPSDSGWGFELLDIDNGTSSPTVVVEFYYPGANGLATWATASGTLNNGSTTLDLQQVTNGYCRTCSPPGAPTGQSIGTMTLHLNPIVNGTAPTGTATIQANFTGGSFTRNNIGIQMLSLPTGE